MSNLLFTQKYKLTLDRKASNPDTDVATFESLENLDGDNIPLVTLSMDSSVWRGMDAPTFVVAEVGLPKS